MNMIMLFRNWIMSWIHAPATPATVTFPDITTLQRLHHRLDLACEAHRAWPSTRTQDQICMIERQIRRTRQPGSCAFEQTSL